MPMDDSGFGKIIGEVVFNSIARVTLPVLSFGYIRVNPVLRPALGFNSFGVFRQPDGRLVVSTNTESCLGLAVAAVVVLLCAYLI